MRAARQPVFNAPPGTLWLCLALLIAYGLFVLAPARWQEWAVAHLAFVPAFFLAQFSAEGPGISAAGLAPLVTYMFLHGDLLHVVVNAGMLLAFGALVERAIGTGRFLFLFFASGIAAAVVQALAVGPVLVAVVGASGGGYGMIGAGVRFLFRGGASEGRRGALVFVAAIMGLNLLFGLAGLGAFVTGAAIAWQAHIGGFVAGLVLVTLLGRRA